MRERGGDAVGLLLLLDEEPSRRAPRREPIASDLHVNTGTSYF
jgi:hypothetical protein